jgi:transcription elongation factor Elf1
MAEKWILCIPIDFYVKWIDIYEQRNSQSRGFATFSVRITENRLKVDMTYGNVPEHETDEVGR